MVFYFTVFSALQKYIRPRVIIECALDAYIPFVKWAIIPYVMWFVWVPLIILLFFFRSREDFWRLSFVLFTGLTFCLLVYLILPNGLALRQVVYGDDLLSQIVRNLYRIDPPANVCPSIHVFNSLAINASVHHSKLFQDKPWFRRANLILAVSICLSTVLLKQRVTQGSIGGQGVVLTDARGMYTKPFNGTFKISYSNGAMKAGKVTYKLPVTMKGGAGVVVDGVKYKGSLVIERNGNGLNLGH